MSILAHVRKKRLWQVQHCSRVHIKASVKKLSQRIDHSTNATACKAQGPGSKVQGPRSEVGGPGDGSI